MPPHSRGNSFSSNLHSKSTPNLTGIATFEYQPGHDAEPDFQDSSDTAVDGVYLEDARSSLEKEILTSSDEASPSNPRGSQQPLYSHISRSQSYLGPAAFAPPFYNRPPTPLPPSPSLTSLLRPPFSSQTSRPTTPDSSDTEGTPNSTAAAVAKSARTATTVPRASPKIPTYEYYGFVLYLASSLAFLMYLLWSYLPTPFLHQLGIYYYPNRWWSLAVPSFLVMTIVYIYVALASYNTTYLTLPMNSIENLVDDAANIAIVDAKGRIIRTNRSWNKDPGKRGRTSAKGGHSRKGSPDHKLVASHLQLDWRSLWNEGTDAVMDVPIGGVCEVLYGSADRGLEDPSI